MKAAPGSDRCCMIQISATAFKPGCVLLSYGTNCGETRAKSRANEHRGRRSLRSAAFYCVEHDSLPPGQRVMAGRLLTTPACFQRHIQDHNPALMGSCRAKARRN